MRTWIPFFAVALAGAGAVFGQMPGVESRPNPVKASTRLQLVASVEPASAKAGTPVLISLRLKNVSAKQVAVPINAFEYDYELFVTDASGREPPRTPLGQRIFLGKYSLLKSDGTDLDPAQEIEASLDIAAIYQITQPGTYYVQAFRTHLLRDPADTAPRPVSSVVEASKIAIEKAASNVVRFTIVP